MQKTIGNKLNLAAKRSTDNIYKELSLLAMGPDPKIHDSLELNTVQFERLEFYGDTRLSAEVNEIIMRTHSFMDPHFMTLLSQNCVCNANLTEVFDQLQLQRLIINSDAMSPKDKADVVESIIGELYTNLDQPIAKSVYNLLIHFIYYLGHIRATLQMNEAPIIKRDFTHQLKIYGRELVPGICGSTLKKKYQMKGIGFVKVTSKDTVLVSLTEKDAKIVENLPDLSIQGQNCKFELIRLMYQTSQHKLLIENLPQTVTVKCLVAVLKGHYKLSNIGIINLNKHTRTAVVPIFDQSLDQVRDLNSIEFEFKEQKYSCPAILQDN